MQGWKGQLHGKDEKNAEHPEKEQNPGTNDYHVSRTGSLQAAYSHDNVYHYRRQNGNLHDSYEGISSRLQNGAPFPEEQANGDACYQAHHDLRSQAKAWRFHSSSVLAQAFFIEGLFFDIGHAFVTIAIGPYCIPKTAFP